MTDLDYSPEEQFEKVVAAVQVANRSLAMALATNALQHGNAHPLILLLVAERLEEQGLGDQALELLRKAYAAAPGVAEVSRRLARLLARQGLLEEAVQTFAVALVVEPNSCEALCGAGEASFTAGDLIGATRYYRRVIDIEPDQPDALSALAVIAARMENHSLARSLAERVLALRPSDLSAQTALARADLSTGAPDLAAARMTTLLDRVDLNDENRIAMLDLRADAWDGLDRHAEAFSDWALRNRILERLSAAAIRSEHQERRIDEARRLVGYFSAVAPTSWQAVETENKNRSGVRGHVFLLGFPRSGTTLLEKVLAGHPEVRTIEEVDHLGAVGGFFLSAVNELNRLARLTANHADTYRDRYWKMVSETLGDNTRNKTIVDKLPLHVRSLPLIAKLFPNAKILFAVRDPRDVVLSCFRRRFRLNAAMFEFLSLEGTAQYYDQIMLLARIYRAKFSFEVKEVRHETMVANFDGEVREILQFIGLDWHAAVRDFAARARLSLRTPSDPQLARGLNADGVGQWRRYSQELEPVLDQLEPWVAHFGYAGEHRVGLK